MAVVYKPKHTQLSHILSNPTSHVGHKHQVKGWIRNERKQAEMVFVTIYDGTTIGSLQLIIHLEKISDVNNINVGACIFAIGEIVKSPAKGQEIELIVEAYEIFGKIVDKYTYLPTIKNISLERLRETQFLRAKFRSMQAIFMIRSKLMGFVHEFFHSKNIHHLDPNIVTTSDCEGAGEVFTITSLDFKDKHKDLHWKDDFFGKQAFLTVSSQLQLEALCSGLGAVYTTNPSFRAEPSKTKRHLGCFTHVEWELAFIELEDLMDFSEEFVTFCFRSVLERCVDEVNELNGFVSKGLENKLRSFIAQPFERISYDTAIDIITVNGKEIMKTFTELKELPKWGDDLGSYCERYISEKIFQKPTFVYNYPKKLKSFYMKQNPKYIVDNHQRETVQGCDLLIPGLGELIGSSIRETDFDLLLKEMIHRKIPVEPLNWYLDLRKNGSFPHGGAGLGFDRLVNICTLMEGNIRDVVPFPVAYKECDY